MTADLLNILPSCVITVTRDYVIRYVNMAAENFLSGSLASLKGHPLAQVIHPSDKLCALIDAAFAQKALIKEYDFPLSGPRMGAHEVGLQILPMDDGEEAVLVMDTHGMTGKLTAHHGAQAAGSMASILAHEVKNPLSGIRGAAQLLQQTASADDRKLTQLICNEVDRIRNVIEEIEIFSNPSELKTEAINIHEVLQYVRTLAEKGDAQHVQFKERYDPSIPHVAGHRNQLIQLFLNMVKNAAEAQSSIITLTTSYQSGFRLKSQKLPIMITVEDNGPGIAPALQASIFEPFITNKEGGKGLGLAIVAKIIADHGGAIELDKETTHGTRFRILLPAA